MKIITRTVWMLSLVSLFTDFASEMLYPIMPIYLKYAGYSVLFIGILEGCAEALAGLSKSYFGRMSDLSGKRLPFVQTGYLFSALSKPMLALFSFPIWIFFSRSLDRLGKGIRTGARDAMLSQQTSLANKARVFGFHRSLDTFGAVLGPAAALLFLYFYPARYKTLFLVAFIPGLLSVVFTLLIKEEKNKVISVKPKPGFRAFINYWRDSSPDFKQLLPGLLLFAIINSSDVFLLLQLKSNGMNDSFVIKTYIFYNLVYALMAYPLGKWADAWGLKKMFLSGLVIFTLVYAGFSVVHTKTAFWILFACYGLYAAATESLAKAWISNVVKKDETATAIGTYSGFQSVCSFIASSLCGLIWISKGATAAFLFSAAGSLLVILYFLFLVKEPEINTAP